MADRSKRTGQERDALDLYIAHNSLHPDLRPFQLCATGRCFEEISEFAHGYRSYRTVEAVRNLHTQKH